MGVEQLSLNATQDRSPFEWYRAARADGGLTWDAELGSWVASSYDAVREICRLDDQCFRRKDAEGGSEYDRMSGGRRTVKVLNGDAHAKLHQWMMSSFTPAKSAALQESVVREVVTMLLDRLDGRDQLELTTDFLNDIPVRVIASVMELPWRDDAWIERVMVNVNRIFAFYNQRGYAGDDLVENGRLAYIEMREILDDILVQRSDGRGDDIISSFWRVGPEILPDWGIEDIFINVMSLFLGGAHTSTLALANAFYLLLSDPALEREVRTADDKQLRAYVEQVLRLHPPQQYQQRRVIKDITITGVDLKEGDLVIMIFASANRDEAHYANPDGVDFTQRNQRDHVTFSAGPHSCVGQGLARAEVFETLRQTLPRMPHLRLEEHADIAYHGLTMRGYGPLPVRVDAP